MTNENFVFKVTTLKEIAKDEAMSEQVDKMIQILSPKSASGYAVRKQPTSNQICAYLYDTENSKIVSLVTGDVDAKNKNRLVIQNTMTRPERQKQGLYTALMSLLTHHLIKDGKSVEPYGKIDDIDTAISLTLKDHFQDCITDQTITDDELKELLPNQKIFKHIDHNLQENKPLDSITKMFDFIDDSTTIYDILNNSKYLDVKEMFKRLPKQFYSKMELNINLLNTIHRLHIAIQASKPMIMLNSDVSIRPESYIINSMLQQRIKPGFSDAQIEQAAQGLEQYRRTRFTRHIKEGIEITKKPSTKSLYINNNNMTFDQCDTANLEKKDEQGNEAKIYVQNNNGQFKEFDTNAPQGQDGTELQLYVKNVDNKKYLPLHMQISDIGGGYYAKCTDKHYLAAFRVQKLSTQILENTKQNEQNLGFTSQPEAAAGPSRQTSMIQ